jgi:LPXTG-motif cell wall-anchored protein
MCWQRAYAPRVPLLRTFGGLAVVLIALAALATPAGALDAVAFPAKGPPGAPVTITVGSCPAGTTDSAAVRFRAAGGAAPPFDPSDTSLTVASTSGGGADVDVTIPIDATAGQYVFDVFCVSEGGGVTDGPETIPFEVALLPVTVTPGQGPVGTSITVTGSGCPTGTTDQVFVRILGASDDVPPFDPNETNQFHTGPNPDGSFSISFAVPGNAPEGENAVDTFCISEGGSVLAGPGHGVFVVTTATTSQGDDDLPTTGSASPSLAIAGIALALLGLAFVRRARSHART